MSDIVSDAQEIRQLQRRPLQLWQLLALAWRYQMPTQTAAQVLDENGMIVNLAKTLELIVDVERRQPETLAIYVYCQAMEWQGKHNSPLLPMYEGETK